MIISKSVMMALESEEDDMTSSDQTSKIDTENLNDTSNMHDSYIETHNIYAGGNSINS